MNPIKIGHDIYRSDRPKDLEKLAAEGFKAIVDLQSGIYELFHDDKFERQFPADFGIKLYHLGCSDFTAPLEWQVNKFLALAQRPDKTLVHCLSGVDRTGFMAAVYRMQIQKWPFEAARDEWIKFGRHPWYFFWEWELRKWEIK